MPPVAPGVSIAKRAIWEPVRLALGKNAKLQSLFRSVALTSQEAQIKNSRQSMPDLTKICKRNSMRISNYFDWCSIWRHRTTEYSSASSPLLYLKRKINSLVNIQTLSLNSFLRKSGYHREGRCSGSRSEADQGGYRVCRGTGEVPLRLGLADRGEGSQKGGIGMERLSEIFLRILDGKASSARLADSPASPQPSAPATQERLGVGGNRFAIEPPLDVLP